MGNSASNESAPGARFLAGCPPIPACPDEATVHSEFESLLRRKLVPASVLDELSSMESTDTKWLYVCLDRHLSTPEAANTDFLDPHVCVQEILDPQFQLDGLHDLFRAVRINIVLHPKEWIERFVVAEGVQALVSLLDPSKTVSDLVHVEALNALFALSSCSHGVDAMVQSAACCDGLLGLFTGSTSSLQRGRVLKLLGILCCHNQAAQSTAISAISRMSSTLDANEAGTTFGLLSSSFVRSDGDLPFQLAVVTFVNTLVNTTLDISERVAIREDLEKLGFVSALEKRTAEEGEHVSTAMTMQIQVFLKSHANDRARSSSAPAPVQRRMSLNIPAAADEPAAFLVAASAGAVSGIETPVAEHEATQSTPQRDGPRSLQTRKSLRLEMAELHTETEEVSGRPMISPPPAPDPVQRRPSGSLLPSLSIPKVSVAFSATKSIDGSEKPSQSTVEVCLPKTSSATTATPVSSQATAQPSLESILAMLQQGTKSLDEKTSQKLLGVLSKLATSITAEGTTSCGKVVDRLEQTLSSPNEPVYRKSPASSPVVPNRITLRLPTRYSDSDVYALAAGTPAKASAASYHSRFQSDESAHGASASGEAPARSPAHSHYEEEHSPRRSMTETESCDESCHEYDTKARSKPSGAKVALAGFFQHLKKGQGLPSTPAPTPMATASVKKDARRPVFPSFGMNSAAPSPMPGHVGSFALPPLTPLKPSISLSLPPLTPVRPSVVSSAQVPMASLLSPRVKEEHLEAVKEEEAEAQSPAVHAAASAGADIAKFRKLLAMGAPKAAVRAKMQQAGVDPDLLDRPDAPARVEPAPSQTVATVVKEETPESTSSGPDISKFRKLLMMGAPLAAVKAKMQQAGLDPALLDQAPSAPPKTSVPPAATPAEEAQPPVPASTKIKDDPSYAKFFKLRTMGAPAEAVKAKIRQAGLNPDYLDTPDADMPSSSAQSALAVSTPETSTALAAPVRVRDDPEYAKFFKLLSMGAPAAAVKAKMQQAGVNPDLLDTPDAVVPSKGGNNNSDSAKPAAEPAKKVLVKDHPDYAKFFKLKTMAPVEVVKAKMRQSGLDPDLLDTPDAEMPTKGGPETPEAPSKLGGAGGALTNLFASRPGGGDSSSNQATSNQSTVLVKDDPAYAKFFKLVAMGAPADTVKGKMQMAGLCPELLDTPDAPLNPVAPQAGGSSNQTSNNAGAAPAAPSRRGNLTLSIKPPNSVAKPTTRPLYWQQMKGETIRGTIWEEIEKEQSKENNELPLFLGDSELGLLEQEFPAQTAPMTGPGKPTRSLSMDQVPKELMSPRVVFLIDRGRANNISIIIKQFRMSHAAIREAAMKVDVNVLTLERVQGLIKILPTDEEVAAIIGYQGDPLSLNEAERILKELITVPRLKQRLTAMQSRLQFPQFVRDLQQKVDKLRAACTEVGSSSEFKTILQVVLQVGNRLNQGTPRGGAKGFRLGDLTKLAQLKAADKTSTLLHYVARMIRQKKGNAVRLSESLSSLYDVQNIPIPELPADMSKVAECVDYVTNEVGAQKLKNAIEEKEPCDHFVKVMGEFLDTAATSTSALKGDLEAMIALLKETMQRFGFQGDNDSSDEALASGHEASSASSNHAALASAGEFFMTIYEFSVALTKADRENEVKRLREEARARQSMKPKTPALGPRSMSSRDMTRKSVVERKREPMVDGMGSGAGPEATEALKSKDKANGSPAATRTSPMLRQRSASLSSIVENNVNIEAILSTLPAKSPSSASSAEKLSVAAGSVEKKNADSATDRTPNGTPAKKAETPETKSSSIKPPTKFVKPSGSSDKDKSSALKPKPAIPLPGMIVKSSTASPKAVDPTATPQKVDYSVCYDSPLGLTMPESLEKPKVVEKPEFEEVTPFDMASIEDIRAQLVKKHVGPEGNNNTGSDAASSSATTSKSTSHSSPEESTAEIDMYAEAFDDDA